jgi:hypothetical protein
MLMSTVCGSEDACTRFASTSGVTFRSSSEMTGRRTDLLFAMSTYVCIRSCVNADPCWRSVAFPVLGIETNSCVWAVYARGVSRPAPSPPSAPTSAAAMSRATFCRRTRR